MLILAIDPGNVNSAYVLMEKETYKPVEFGLLENNLVREKVLNLDYDCLAIEMVASYGMAVGESVFDTCVWIGRFIECVQKRNIPYTKVYRMEEKMNICHDSRAKDCNIRQALIDKFGFVGTKKNPGFFYGFKKDIWAAFAVGCTYIDTKL